MIKFRAERVDGGGKVEGNYFKTNKMVAGEYICENTTYVNFAPDLEDGMSLKDYEYHGCSLGHFVEIKPETLEIYLFGEWRLVADLEEKFVLLDKEHSEKLHDMT